MILLLPFLGVGDAVAAGLASCPQAYTTSDLVEVVALIEADYRLGDHVRADAHRAALEGRLTCTCDLLSPDALSQIHLAEALSAHLDVRDDRAQQALAAALVAQSGWQLPVDLLPPADPVRALLPAALLALRDDPGVPLPTVAHGLLEVDGVASATVPSQRAAVVQQRDGQGALLATYLRWPDDPDFSWVIVDAPVDVAQVATPAADSTAPGSVSDPTGRARRRRTRWAVATAGGTLLASACFGISAYENRIFEESPPLPSYATADYRASYRSSLKRTATLTDAATVGGAVATAGALALATVLVLRW